MKKSFLSLLVLLTLVSVACSFSNLPIVGGSRAQETVRPTSPFDVTAAPPTATPQGKEVNEVYDDFTNLDEAWGEPFTVTTQAKSGSDSANISYTDGKLVFTFLAKETYVYQFYRNVVGPSVVVEAKYQAGGHANNGIALVCRVNEDHTAWYELRLSSTNLWGIYRYDADRREAGRNPYVQLKTGGANIETLYPTRENIVRFTCDGSRLTAGANGVELATVQDNDLTEGSQAGIGAMSTDTLPISVMFDYVSIQKP